MTHFTGKTALVTGGSRGIGAAIVRRLALGGADVAFTYAGRKDEAEALAAELGGKTSAHQVDIRSPDAVKALFAAIDTRFGGAPNLDILINNAGYGSDGESSTALGGVQEEHYDRVFDTNVKGTFFVSQEAMPRLRDMILSLLHDCAPFRAGIKAWRKTRPLAVSGRPMILPGP
jgi:3-oxoacyl-[acyl-carrier protein] reductase